MYSQWLFNIPIPFVCTHKRKLYYVNSEAFVVNDPGDGDRAGLQNVGFYPNIDVSAWEDFNAK
jgi:hypothetical protein